MNSKNKKSPTAKYFEVLGLPEDSGATEIEARYQELSTYFGGSDLPGHLQEWGREQAARVDEAYAMLSDPDLRAGLDGELEEQPVAPVTVATAAPPAPQPAQTASGRRSARLPLMALALGIFIGSAALLAVVVAEMGFEEGEEDPAAEQVEGEQFVPIDTERVAELVTSYQADQTNPETLFELGEAYFLAGEWQQGLDWFQKLVVVDAANVHAWTDVGTAHYNLGQIPEAQTAWQKGLELAPEDPQLHYNMGFLYANAETPDFEAARREWQTVLDLAPGTQLAQTVQVHMEGLAATSTPEVAAAP
jgi:tetratricopeptide (TPR) repeat protein